MTAKLDTWRAQLNGDFDADFILEGVGKGFNILDSTPQVIKKIETKNHKSALDRRSKVEKLLTEEILAGNYLVVTEKPDIISAIGAVDKPDSEDIRLIVDASLPEGEALNDYANPKKFDLDTVDQVTQVLKRGWYQAKIDLKSGYRSVPIATENYRYTGVKWKFDGASDYTYLVDTRLPMGASKSPSIFQRITSSVCRMMRKKGFFCYVYLDDFYVCDSSFSKCKRAYDYLWSLLTSLGFTINSKKSVSPRQCLVFLGIQIDSVTLSMKIPDVKILELKCELERWITLKSASKKSIQSLIGKMNWVARCVKASCPHMRSIIVLLKGLRQRSRRVRLTAEAKKDILWWQKFAMKFNGVSTWKSSLPDHVIATDASLSGGAAVYAGDFLYANWECDFPAIKSMSINILEMYVILLALRRWANRWRSQSVHIYTDSNVALYAISKGRMKSVIGMKIIKEIHMLSALMDIDIVLKRIDTKSNCFADALSRFDDPNFAEKALAMLMEYKLHKCPILCNPLSHMSHVSWLHLLQLWSTSRR